LATGIGKIFLLELGYILQQIFTEDKLPDVILQLF
jgi:hypothetical protein